MMTSINPFQVPKMLEEVITNIIERKRGKGERDGGRKGRTKDEWQRDPGIIMHPSNKAVLRFFASKPSLAGVNHFESHNPMIPNHQRIMKFHFL